MDIIDLSKDHQQLYFLCLEDWSEEVKEGEKHRAVWFNTMKDRGLRVKLALDDAGNVGGMIQYVPIEHSFAEGTGLYFVHCIWVHGHKQGRGNCQKKGMGKALLSAAEEDARALGASGMAAWGMTLPFWMRASWFGKQGYSRADRVGMQALMWKPFSSRAAAPSWIRSRKKPQGTSGRVVVTGLLNGWCSAQNMVFERARRASSEFGDRVEFRHIDTLDRETFMEWGMGDALFLDDKEVRTGPPPSYEKIRQLIHKKVSKLKR
jgi:GNAT superfamily N-acetyltransferase